MAYKTKEVAKVPQPKVAPTEPAAAAPTPA